MSLIPKTSLGCVVLLAVTSTCPLVAHAGAGPYIGIEGGLNLLDNQKLDAYGFAGNNNGNRIGRTEFSSGWLGGLTTGYTLENGFRPELAIAHRQNSFERLQLTMPGLLGLGSTSIDTTDVSGREKADTAMFNLWYELPLSSSLRPYIGVGAGAAHVSIRGARYDNNELHNASETLFAWQAGAGFAFNFTKQVTASLDYRFLQTNRGEFDLLDDNPTTHLRARYRSNSIQFGLRYSFGAEEAPAPEPVAEPVAVVPVEPVAPPPPPPPPPPCEVPADGTPMNFQGCKLGDTLVLHGVNFQFDKATLTLNAKALLDQVADALQTRADIKVELDGYTDSKGSDAYNQKLSEQRATAVQDYLVTRGIAAERMVAKGFGEASPIADNDSDEGRERNRRVELKVTEAADTGADAGGAAVVDDSSMSEPANGSDAPELTEVGNSAPPTPVDPVTDGQ